MLPHPEDLCIVALLPETNQKNVKSISHLSIAFVAALALAPTTARSAVTLTTVYDNLGTAATAGFSALNTSNPVYGDALTLLRGGKLNRVGLSLYNGTSGGNTGSILTGTMLVSFYDNTIPYASGLLASKPLLGTANLTWDFTGSGGLAAGYYNTDSFDLSALNITVPQNILVTQQFTQTSGTSLRNGVALLSNPVVGSSPATVYMKSSVSAEGIYTFSAPNPNQFGFFVEIQEGVSAVPEPGSLFAVGCFLGSGLFFRVRRSRA